MLKTIHPSNGNFPLSAVHGELSNRCLFHLDHSLWRNAPSVRIVPPVPLQPLPPPLPSRLSCLDFFFDLWAFRNSHGTNILNLCKFHFLACFDCFLPFLLISAGSLFRRAVGCSWRQLTCLVNRTSNECCPARAHCITPAAFGVVFR